MTSPDIEHLRASLTAGRQPDMLAVRIVQSLGARPMKIPSRTTLAIESLAARLGLAAALVSGVALGAGLATRGRAATPPTSIVATAIEGGTAPASEVFAAMTGLDARAEDGR